MGIELKKVVENDNSYHLHPLSFVVYYKSA